MNERLTRWLGPSVMLIAISCGGQNIGNPDGPDPVSTDGGDQVPRTLCPAEGEACTQASDCGVDDIDPPTNCTGCIPYNRAVCARGACSSPEMLSPADPVNYVFQVEGLKGRIESLAGIVITAESSGGKRWSCEDVYAGRVDLTNPCHNILDTRGMEIGREDNQYTLTFTRFPGGQLTLFVVYGYSGASAQGEPIGVTCGTQHMGGPGGGLLRISGDTMRPIQ